jgi:uncharacterized YigZ family protein
MSGYPVPAATHRSEIVVVNSRFVTTVGRADTVDAAKAFIATIRAEMPVANHHVYAYRVGYGNSITEGMSDDGEPSGTSGPPTLAVLRGVDIGDTVLVTTRFFGGTKLGTGGLVRAYTEAAQTALSGLSLTRRIERRLVGLDLPYHHYQSIKRLIEQCEGSVKEETFAADVTILALFPADKVDRFSASVQELTAGSLQPVILS